MSPALAMVLAGGVVTLVPAEAAEAAHAADPVVGDLSWGPCPSSGNELDPGQECATLAVPLDYDHPSGRRIEIAVSRIASADPATRRGVLLSNPGGPGESGRDLPTALAGALPADVLEQYDLIGFDPRGVGFSTPVTCGIDEETSWDLLAPYPDPDGSIDRNIAFARSTARDCALRSGALLPHITTANTARDMDYLRQVLGEERISYYGGSYGTYLGAVYTTLFPDHTDRFVLDSAANPRTVWYEMWRSWSPAVALRFDDLARYVAARDDTLGFGRTVDEVTAAYTLLSSQLDEAPVTVPGTGTVIGGNLLRELTRETLYSDASLPRAALVWRLLADVVAGESPEVDPALAQLIEAWATPIRTAAGLGIEVPSDNEFASLYAVICNDARWPRSTEQYQRAVLRDRALWPLTAGMPSNIWPCAFWPSRDQEPPVEVTDRGPRNILILQYQRDPASPWESGQAMNEALGSRSVLVGVDAGGHGVYGKGSCADEFTNAFLSTGRLPDQDQYCSAEGAAAGGVR